MHPKGSRVVELGCDVSSPSPIPLLLSLLVVDISFRCVHYRQTDLVLRYGAGLNCEKGFVCLKVL